MTNPATYITDHLDTWSSAIKAKSSAGRGGGKKQEFYGIKKLRELILELAVRGLLVPQNPKDEPASKLVKQIENERQNLAKSGLVGKPKSLPPIEGDEVPFELPTGWTFVRNGSLFGLKKGKVPKDLSESEGAIPYLDIEALDRGNIYRYTNDHKAPRSTDRDILVVCDGSRSGLVLDGQNGAIGSTLSVIETPSFIQGFVKLIFRQGYQRLNSTMKGAAIPHLDTKNLLVEVTGLPPLAEQHRIVTRVDELMALCDQLEQQQEDSQRTHGILVKTLLGTLTAASEHGHFPQVWQRIASHFDTLFTTENSIDELKQSILQLAVMGRIVHQDPKDEPASKLVKRLVSSYVKGGKVPKALSPIDLNILPFGLPTSWDWVQAQDLCRPAKIITYGILKPIWVESGIPTVRVQDMKNGLIDESDLGQCSPERAAKFTKTTLETGDLLIAKDGATLGKTAFVPVTLAGGNITQHVLRFPISEHVDSFYVRLVIDSRHGQSWMKGETKGVALPGVNVGDFRRMPFPLPPFAEQQRIVARVEELMAVCDRLKASLKAAQVTQLNLADSLIEAAIH